ncbi:bifunctional UDP-sugar hydrolase/5'-nucleotidase [Brevibacterium samyangense]
MLLEPNGPLMKKILTPALGALTAVGLSCGTLVAPALAVASEGTEVQLLGITDFHGRLADAGVAVANAVETARADFDGPTAFLSAGDNIGASTYESSSQQDTPTLEYLNAIGLQASAVGNHEFDRGFADLTGRVADEAAFPYLGANVYATGTETLADGVEASTIVDAGDVTIGVIGVVTAETETLVSPAGIADIDFGDPTEAVNREAERLESLPEAQRPDMIVVQAHVGTADTSSLEAAVASNADFGDLVEESSPAVDALFFGHTHVPFDTTAPIPGTDRERPIVQAGNYGEYLSAVRMTSLGNGDWTVADQELIAPEDVAPLENNAVVDEATRIVDDAIATSEEVGSEVIGTITEDITRAGGDADDRGAESTLGNLVADALQYGTSLSQFESDFAITNPGGLRDDLLVDDTFGSEAPGEVTAAELNAVLPFANDHVVVELSGADVITLFEQQWQPADSSRPFLHLGISEQLDVVYDSTAEEGARVLSVKVNGEEIDPEATYTVATLSFLASGGDNFSAFANGTTHLTGLTDFEVWQSYFENHSPVSPDHAERQADAALDVIATGALPTPQVVTEGAAGTVSFANPEAIAGPFLLTVTAPEGVTVSFDELAGTRAAENGVVVDELPAGGLSVPFTVDGAAGTHTLGASFVADPAAAFWDDNPLPLPYSTDFEVTLDEAPSTEPPATDEPTAEPTSEVPTTEAPTETETPVAGGDAVPTDESDATDEGAAGDASGALPRTGSTVVPLVALGVLLLAAGSAVVLVSSRRR